MKIKDRIFQALFLGFFASILILGCKKETEDKDTSASSDNAFAEQAYSDVFNVANEAERTGSLTSYKTSATADGLLSACATITRDSSNNTNADTITIDFGSSNCVCADGRSRRGKIIVTYTGRYRDSLTTINISFNNYFVNDNQLLGTKQIVNKGHNAAGHLVHEITVNGQIVKANGGGTISWVATRQREWTQGESTLIWSDDVYSITGSAAGTGANGVSYTATITSPLIRNMSLGCRKHFVQGAFTFTPSNKPIRIIDFGNGTCDNIATVTINGNVYTIQL